MYILLILQVREMTPCDYGKNEFQMLSKAMNAFLFDMLHDNEAYSFPLPLSFAI